MKTVSVNAWVTFFLWIVEGIAIFCVLIAWVFVYSETSFFTWTNSMLWFYVILPYTFLMNTSYNKARIVDDGWKAVFANSVPASFNCNVFRRNHRIDPITKDSRQHLKHSKGNVTPGKGPSDLEPSTSLPLSSLSTKRSVKEGNQTLQNEQLDISVISRSEIGSCSLKHDSSQPVGELKPVHSNSENSQHSLRKTDRLIIGEKILSNMVLHINNEDAYIHYFKQLIEVDYVTKN